MQNPTKILLILQTVILFLYSVPFSAGHGYILGSRSDLCKGGENSDCGPIIFEPQSLEGPDRFPQSGPADGKLASAGIARFSPLDEQTATRWKKTDVQSGPHDFVWIFTANHSTRDWRYFLTKSNWNPSQPLTRESFDLEPFCTFEGANQRPPSLLTHTCSIPDDREGYHVVLAVWDVGDTSNSFYNMIDLNLENSGTEEPDNPWNDIGDIFPSMDLPIGSRVLARFFSAEGEQPEFQVSIDIDTQAQGGANAWPFQLSEAINESSNELTAGILNNDIIAPVFGKNDVFARNDSDIVRAEVTIQEPDPEITPDFTITGLAQNYFVNEGESLEISLEISVNQPLKINAFVYDFEDNSVAFSSSKISDNGHILLPLNSTKPGQYSLVIIGETEDSQKVQKTFAFELKEEGVPPENTLTYPENKGSYLTGDRLRGYDGNLYECNVPGWCNGDATYYAPGSGLAWNSAWIIDENVPPIEVTTPERNPVYPDGRSTYEHGDIIEGLDGRLYFCDIAPWCNSTNELHYAPGAGLQCH